MPCKQDLNCSLNGFFCSFIVVCAKFPIINTSLRCVLPVRMTKGQRDGAILCADYFYMLQLIIFCNWLQHLPDSCLLLQLWREISGNRHELTLRVDGNKSQGNLAFLLSITRVIYQYIFIPHFLQVVQMVPHHLLSSEQFCEVGQARRQ